MTERKKDLEPAQVFNFKYPEKSVLEKPTSARRTDSGVDAPCIQI